MRRQRLESLASVIHCSIARIRHQICPQKFPDRIWLATVCPKAGTLLRRFAYLSATFLLVSAIIELQVLSHKEPVLLTVRFPEPNSAATD